MSTSDATSGEVVVTGATGTIGREVVRALATLGTRSIVAVRSPEDSRTRQLFADLDVELRRFDYEDPTSFDAFAGATALFSVTPLVAEPVATSRRALEAAHAWGIRHVVRLSSRATGWDDAPGLREWHRAIEADVERVFSSYTHLRPCSFFQNLATQHGPEIKARDRLVLPLGWGRIAYVDAIDVGAVAAVCLRDPAAHAGATYVLTGPRAVSGDEIAHAIGEARGKPVRYVAADPAMVRERSSAAGVPEWLLESGLRVFANAVEGGEAAVERTVETLCGRPARSLEDFARDNVEAFEPQQSR